LDRVNKVILFLPFWALLDVASTLYTESRGYSLALYEVGLFARFFVHAGLTHVYAVAYFLIVAGFACFFWFAKNRVLTPSHVFDRVLFVLLVCGLGYMYVVFASTIVGNLFLPSVLERHISSSAIFAVVAAGTIVCLAFYVRHDVMLYLKAER
jgi:hypothetical protein